MINFITAAILRYEKPKAKSIFTLVTESPFRSQIYSLIFDLYWDSDKRPKYAASWINLLVSKDKLFIAQMISAIVKYIRNKEIDKIDILINILKSSNRVPNYKLREEDFLIMSYIKKYSEEQVKKIADLITILCQKGYMHITRLIETEIENILIKLYEYNLETKSLLDSLDPYTRSSIFNEWERKYRI